MTRADAWSRFASGAIAGMGGHIHPPDVCSHGCEVADALLRAFDKRFASDHGLVLEQDLRADLWTVTRDHDRYVSELGEARHRICEVEIERDRYRRALEQCVDGTWNIANDHAAQVRRVLVGGEP